jgi:hypothetical protein
VIQRYGIYNPYTGRGAIKGLLPHGPHNLRDILATHILKQTGSYEQASYAIQDTPDVVQQHYGRFLPQDKAALACQDLEPGLGSGITIDPVRCRKSQLTGRFRLERIRTGDTWPISVTRFETWRPGLSRVRGGTWRCMEVPSAMKKVKQRPFDNCPS